MELRGAEDDGVRPEIGADSLEIDRQPDPLPFLLRDARHVRTAASHPRLLRAADEDPVGPPQPKVPEGPAQLEDDRHRARVVHRAVPEVGPADRFFEETIQEQAWDPEPVAVRLVVVGHDVHDSLARARDLDQHVILEAEPVDPLGAQEVGDPQLCGARDHGAASSRVRAVVDDGLGRGSEALGTLPRSCLAVREVEGHRRHDPGAAADEDCEEQGRRGSAATDLRTGGQGWDGRRLPATRRVVQVLRHAADHRFPVGRHQREAGSATGSTSWNCEPGTSTSGGRGGPVPPSDPATAGSPRRREDWSMARREEPRLDRIESARKRLRAVRHFVLDMDGTVYLGSRVFPWTGPFLALLRDRGAGYTFVTNNNSRGVEEYAARLRSLGVHVYSREIYTSTMATVEYLAERSPVPRRLFVLGTQSLRDELRAAGFTEGGESPDSPPDAVVVGFDTSLRYERLCSAAYWISKGRSFIATHPDRVCPTDEDTVLPDCGSLCACLAHATGRAPDAVLGKPSSRMVLGAIRGKGVRIEDVAVVGDRIYTDMAMARASGALAVLVLSGETTKAEADARPEAADVIVRDLQELGELLVEARGRSPADPAEEDEA